MRRKFPGKDRKIYAMWCVVETKHDNGSFGPHLHGALLCSRNKLAAFKEFALKYSRLTNGSRSRALKIREFESADHAFGWAIYCTKETDTDDRNYEIIEATDRCWKTVTGHQEGKLIETQL